MLNTTDEEFTLTEEIGLLAQDICVRHSGADKICRTADKTVCVVNG